ncbi:MAG: chlorophyll synthesis pathway protein BchC [Alphaproteobacteria bacterium]|nr:chlorophyll synthesis pathway protein BchC [Alphaproteobacteria bacterium]
MRALAVLMEAPETLAVRSLSLHPIGEADVRVDVAWSGISTGTERLLWTGRMPPFPGMGYPLVPGYEAVGRIVEAGPLAGDRVGEWVFVAGARCFEGAHGLFGAAAQTLIVPAARALPVAESLGERGVLVALAATAYHMLADGAPPELIIGHGVLGRLLARLTLACGAPAPVVWETNPERRSGAEGRGYAVVSPDDDERRDYRAIYDVSGDVGIIDTLISRLGRGGELVLGGFYHAPVAFTFPPAFQREARLRIAAEWQPADLDATLALIASRALDLSGLVTDVRPVREARAAYDTAFNDPRCLKMAIDWRDAA